jgi:hypothetical protein
MDFGSAFSYAPDVEDSLEEVTTTDLYTPMMAALAVPRQQEQPEQAQQAPQERQEGFTFGRLFGGGGSRAPPRPKANVRFNAKSFRRHVDTNVLRSGRVCGSAAQTPRDACFLLQH